MTKKLLIIAGSPRIKGNSTVLALQAAQAARTAKIEVELLHLSRMKISPCYGCDRCREGKTFCILKDDMQSVYPKLLEADALLLASPVYFYFYSAQLKTFVDRWYGLWHNRPDFLKAKPVGLILTHEDANLEVSGGIHAVRSLQSTVEYVGGRFIGVVNGSLGAVGDAQKHPELLQAASDLGRQLAAELDQ